MPNFCRINYFFHVSFSFFMHSLLKEKKPEAKRQKRVLYIGSGRVGSGQGVPGTGSFHGQLHQIRRRVRMSRAAAASLWLAPLARSFFVDPSSSRALVAFRVFVAGPVYSPCFPLCALSSFFLSLCVCALNVCTHRYSVLFLLW